MTNEKLLILDVDGVMTDGTKAYGLDGLVVWKKFADIDFTAIKKFQSRGWRVCWLSADKVVNEIVAANRHIDFWYSRDDDGSINKVRWLHKLISHYNIPLEDVIYVGDDLFDVPIIKAVMAGGGRAFYPSNAAPQMQHISGIEALGKSGGGGAIMDLLFKLFPLDCDQPCG